MFAKPSREKFRIELRSSPHRCGWVDQMHDPRPQSVHLDDRVAINPLSVFHPRRKRGETERTDFLAVGCIKVRRNTDV